MECSKTISAKEYWGNLFNSSSRNLAHLLILTSLLLFGACQGTIGEPEATPKEIIKPPPPAVAGDPTGVTGVRRLSPLEIEGTVFSVFEEFGVSTSESLSPPLIPVGTRHDFTNTVEQGNISSADSNRVADWAESMSAIATENVDVVLGCTPTSEWDECVANFTSRLARLTLRRAPQATDLSIYESVYGAVVAEATPAEGVRALWEVAFQSPEFWYLSAAMEGDSSRLTSDAIASHLSYALWGTMPDQALRTRADAGELETAEQVQAVALEMLSDERAKPTVSRFHREWLHLATLSELEKDPAIYPNYNEDTARDLGTEYDAFVQRTVLEGGTIADLFGGRMAYVNDRLETLYGLSPQSTGSDDWNWRELGAERAGVLTRPLFLASTAGQGESLLIHRGVAVVEHLLCTQLTAPPEATTEAVPIDPNATSGKLAGVENRASKSNCAGCHETIDPIGLAFESFDAIGAFRTAYPDEVAIDPAGAIAANGFLEESVTYTNAAELNIALGQSVDVQKCYASKWLEYMTGQSANSAQRFELARIASTPDISIEEILIQVLVSPMFTERVDGVRP